MASSEYRLPPKPDGTPYSLAQVVARCDHSVSNSYQRSYRFALAVQQLQEEVERVVRRAEPAAMANLFPADDLQAHAICFNAGFDKELRFDPTKETARVENGKPSWRTPYIRAAQNDALLMARKHVVDMLDETNGPGLLAFDLSGREKALYRQNNAASVQQLMILLADNAMNHKQLGAGIAA